MWPRVATVRLPAGRYGREAKPHTVLTMMAILPTMVKTTVVTLPSYQPALRQHDALVHIEFPLHANFKVEQGSPTSASTA